MLTPVCMCTQESLIQSKRLPNISLLAGCKGCQVSDPYNKVAVCIPQLLKGQQSLRKEHVDGKLVVVHKQNGVVGVCRRLDLHTHEDV